MKKLASRAKSVSVGAPSTCGYAPSMGSNIGCQPNHSPSHPSFGYQGMYHQPPFHPYMNVPSHMSTGSEPIRSFSPVPILEYPNLVDFREPIIVGSYSTNPMQLRMALGTPWAKASLMFRSVKNESMPIPPERNPFLIREKEFNLGPGQHIQLEIKFQPMQGGHFTAMLEIQLSYPDQYNRPMSQAHTINIIGQSIEPVIHIGSDDSKSEFIEVRKNTVVPIKNDSNFTIPVIIEIDQGNFYQFHYQQK